MKHAIAGREKELCKMRNPSSVVEELVLVWKGEGEGWGRAIGG